MIDIKALRIEQGMTQKELAEKSGIKASNLCRYELGQRVPTTKTMSKILQALGLEINIKIAKKVRRKQNE